MIEITLEGRGPNTMTRGSLEAVARRIEDAGTRPIVVTGAGRAFSSGLDLDALASMDRDGLAELLMALERTVSALFMHPAPTLAVVNGHAVAGGCLLAQCCDLRIATDAADVRIGMTGVAAGLTYPSFVFGLLRHRLAPPHLERVLLGAERFTPEGALAVGLLDGLAAPDALHAESRRRLARLEALPREAYADTKRTLRAAVVEGWQADSKRANDALVPRWTQALQARASGRPGAGQ